MESDKVISEIHAKLLKVYHTYKDYPEELIEALEFFIEAVDNDQFARLIFELQEKNKGTD